MESVTIGMRARSGWATWVVVEGNAKAPEVRLRQRIELVEPAEPLARQPYHAAEKMSLDKAEKWVNRCLHSATMLAEAALRQLLTSHAAVASCVLVSAARPAVCIGDALKSHTLIHAAEGDHFREALREASRRCGLRLISVQERAVYEEGAARLRVPVEDLVQRVAEMGRAVGRPWRVDEKLAAMAAWLALATPTS
ncbi:MAG: hypothetical protein HY235_08615 [Acidobacteria bacterium]|nr:hypothetical protein [Acidobacteriota bacterium]